MIMSTRLSVLLLEDEAIIALDIEDVLRDEGVVLAATINNCADALVWLAEHEPDLAIVDPRLKDGSCGPVVQQLIDRDIPFIVYSGDVAGAGTEDPAFKRGIQLGKPSGPEQIVSAMIAALKDQPNSSVSERSIL